jgi:predicted TIM-barrel fold metal-dependent hydrolase
VALGDPLKLESALTRHPKLRIVVVGAGWPFGDAMAGLMQRYPQVSVDIRPLTKVLPDAELQAYVRRLADAGVGARILSSQ